MQKRGEKGGKEREIRGEGVEPKREDWKRGRSRTKESGLEEREVELRREERKRKRKGKEISIPSQDLQ